jgi:hypothetical protein
VVERSVHDNRIIRYLVDSEHRRIVLYTKFDDERDPPEFTDIVFEGVLAYHFEGDNFDNIIFSVEESSLSKLMSENRELFIRGRDYHWPGSWNESPEAALHYFESEGGRAFAISSSYGMAGWVVAQECRLEAPEGDATRAR